MEIKKGYKNTEIGVIPMDWIIKKMKDICWVNQGLQIPIEQRYKKPIKNSKVYITIQYLGNGKDVEYIKEYSQSVCCDKDDILMTRTGNTGIVITDVQGVFHNNFFKINFDKKQIDRKYLLYFLRDTKTQKIILEKAGTSTIPDLNHNDFYSIQIPLPPLPEQTAIATVLSDTDNLIQALEKKIAKKQLIKKGAMQKLLSPKEDWVVKTLGEIAEITGAGVDKKINDNEVEVTLLNYLDVYKRDYIYRNELNHKVTAPINKVKSCNVKKGDIFLTPSSELRTDIGISAISMENMEGVVYSYHIYRLRYFIDIDELFGLFLLKTRRFLKQSETMCEGSGKRYVVSMGKFRNMQVSYPKSKQEQTRIATILSDMDAEIEALEKKLAKYKQIKQGLMQVLLTGKIRLV